MAFHRKDEGRAAADDSLSTALLQDLDDGAIAAWEGRLRRACWSFDARNRPRWSSDRGSVLPLLWRQSLGVKGITIRIRGVCSVEDVTVELVARRAWDLDRPLIDTAITSATLSPSGSQQTITLTLDETTLGHTAWELDPASREWVFLLILTSTRDSGTPMGGPLTAWDRWSVTFDAAAALSDSIPAAVLEVIRTPAAGGPAVTPPDGYPLTAEILRTIASTDQVYTYPPPGNSYVSTGGLGIWSDDGTIYLLGYLLLDDVEVEETSVYPLPARGYGLNAGQYPAAEVVRRAYAAARKVFGYRTQVHRMGPPRILESSAYQDNSLQARGSNAAAPAAGTWYAGAVTSSTIGYGPINQTRGEIKIVDGLSNYDPNTAAAAGNFTQIATGTAYGPRTFEDQDNPGSNQDATSVESLLLVSVSTYSEGGTFGVRARQHHRGAATPEGQIQTVECQAARHLNDDPHADLAGYLLHWVVQPDGGTVANQRLHPQRGFIPRELFHLYRLRLLRLRDVWDAATPTAVIAIEAQLSDHPLDGGRTTESAADRLLHLHGLLMLEGEGTDPAELGA